MKSTAIQGTGGFLAAVSRTKGCTQENKGQETDFSAVIGQVGIQNQEVFQGNNTKPEEKSSSVNKIPDKKAETMEKTEPDVNRTEKYQDTDVPEKQPEEEAAASSEKQEVSSTANPRNFEDIPQEMVSRVEEFLNRLKAAVCRELSMTEEELIAALEKLGFTVADFVNPETVNRCIRSLCGAQSVTELLVDEQLYMTYSQIQKEVMSLTELLSTDMELTKEEIAIILPKLEEMQEAAKAGLDGNLTEQTILELPAEGEQKMAEDSGILENTVQTARTGQEAEAAVVLKADRDKAEPELQGMKENTEEGKAEVKPVSENLQQMEQNTDTAQQNFLGNQNQPEMQAAQQPRVENVFQPETPFTSFTNYDGSYESIIRQVAEQVRVQVTADASTMEMHLNPESLGKLSLSVELKQGMVTARFVAESEQVKEAIESQAALLREDLDRQGVKVEAIEVAVETHEFERNLEQGQQHSQAEEEARNAENERSRNRRNLNLDVLEEEEELTEEEDLAAKIMKENGNTMDYFA